MTSGGKFCLITGAAGGIGCALVRAFSQAGYEVIGLDKCNRPIDLDCQYWLHYDLTDLVNDAKIANALFGQVSDIVRDQGLCVLVNNAAVQILGEVVDLDLGAWKETIDVNVLAPYILTQGLLGNLENARGGVINIGSIHANLTKKSFVAYATSKAALAGMTRALAVELGGRVRVNIIEPAAIATDMLKAGFIKTPEKYAKLKSCHPCGEIGSPEQLAKVVLAVSDDSLSFLTGSTISLNGGVGARLYDPD